MTKDHDSDVNAHFSDSDAERKQSIQRWIKDKTRKWAGRGVAGGLGSTLLALPALAQATIEELYEFQFAETIPGVRSAKLMKNGDVLLTMSDGKTMIVAAENVQVLDSGAIMIAENAVAEIAQFGLVAETAGAASAAGGLGGMGAVLGGLGVAGAAAAAGAGGGGGSNDSPAPAPNYPDLNLADVQTDAIGSERLGIVAPEDTQSIEVTIGSVTTTATPAADGSWSVSLTPTQISSLPQGITEISVRSLDIGGEEIAIATRTVDVDTIPPAVSITGFSAGSVMNAAEQSSDLVITGTTDAEDGQIVTVSMNGGDYLATVSDGQWSATVPSADLSGLADDGTISVTADVQDAAGNPAARASAGFATDFTAPTITLDPVAGGSIELVDVSNDLVLSGSTSAVDGQPVTVDFNGQSYSTTALASGWTVTIPAADLASLTTGTPVSVSVGVTDAAGNMSNPTTASVSVDLTAPSIVISPLSVGDTINATEVGSDLIISGGTGRVSDGQIVTVRLNGTSYTDTVSSGTWSVTVPASDLAALSDGGDFSITADVSDSDGLAASQASISVSKDVSAPTLSIDNLSSGPVLNADEQGSELTISGSTSAEDNQDVTVVLDGQTYTTSVSGGSWSVTVPASGLTGLGDGTSVNVTADVADAAGNPAVQASSSFTTDFTAPTVAITTLSDGAVMNASEQGTNLEISGTSDAADGTVIAVQIARPDGTIDVSGTATVSSNAWTYTATASDLGALQDGTTYNVSANVVDVAGNSAADSAQFSTDFTAPQITLDALPVGATLDIAERGSNLSVSGTTTAEDGRIVTVNLDGIPNTGIVSNGTWSVDIPASDLSGLNDSDTYTISASVSDSSGNISTPATVTLATDFRPFLRLDPIGSNGAITLSDAQSSGVLISGNSVGLNENQTIAITLNSGSIGTATVAADGSWSLAVASGAFSGLNPGDALNFQAQATVSGGPDPVPATDQNVAYEATAYTIVEAGRSGSTVTFEVYADPDSFAPGGLYMTATLGIDPSVITFDAGSQIANEEFDLFSVNPVDASTVNFSGAAVEFNDLSQPLITFDMTVQDVSQPIELTFTSDEGGPTTLRLGTTSNDNLVASNTDNIIRGQEGDDTIDVTAAGRDIVIFEADPGRNGTDTIMGFTIGPKADVTDAIMFSGLDVSTLRGAGTGFETLETGGTVATDTGFIGLTTILADLTAGTIETAVETFGGVQAGDELFVLATDGDDGLLVKVDYSSSNSASVETVAHFSGLEDVSGFSADNILHTDPTGSSV